MVVWMMFEVCKLKIYIENKILKVKAIGLWKKVFIV